MEQQKKSLYFEAATMPASGAWAQKRRLAANLRIIIDRLVTSDAPEEQLARAADAAASFAESLAGHPHRQRMWGFAESANAGVGAFFDQSPLIGLSNPLAPPMTLEARGDRVYGEVCFGSAYEGPPGHVHGGFVAAAFDELLGFTQSLTGNPGMTASLTVRYRRPTPLHVTLRFDAGVDRVDGRKIYASGRVLSGETVTAEADALFVSVDPERFQALIDEVRTR
ncbi:MAG TPA: PaaI family thioesterase [Candidatus Limnocylindrales bacterium]|nr:PaaI family thioesterase [Candidatus Limnocylindrales bacterium]